MRQTSPPPPHGDEAELFRTLQPRLLAVVGRRVTAPQAVIEDACSYAWEQLFYYQPEREGLLAWLTVVASHAAIRRKKRDLRAARRVDNMRAEDLPGPPDPELRERALEALERISRLPPRQRELLPLVIAGYSREEIAERTGHSYTAVRRHIGRGWDNVRRRAAES